MQEITREQEAAIAQLAMTHDSVRVERQQQPHVVQVNVGGKSLSIDEDGNVLPEPIETVPVRLPVGLLRDLLGAEAVEAGIAAVQAKTYPDIVLGQNVAADVRVEITRLLEARVAS